MYLYHYFDKEIGPFKSLSDLSKLKAEEILSSIRINKPESLCAKRDSTYFEKRKKCEEIIRGEFLKIGGKIMTKSPHYMVVEHSPWLSKWYEKSDYIKIDIEEFDLQTISFTYGDSMPTFSPLINDGKEYRKKVYNYNEIKEIIKKYDLPQKWNDDGKYGPERYIEAHIWSDEVINKYINI